MPLLIALNFSYELISYDGVNMYSGIRKIFDRPATAYRLSGNGIKSACERNSDLYDLLIKVVGQERIGTIWYMLLFLHPNNSQFDVRQATAKLFNKICEASDLIARMEANAYQYSTIPCLVATLTIEFETLLRKSYQPNFEQYEQYDEYDDTIEYRELQKIVIQESYPKIMAYYNNYNNSKKR